jgi:YidC/Oxa1 family membrane protein insertase
MERRFVLFLVLSMLILVGNSYIFRMLNPPPAQPPVAAVKLGGADVGKGAPKAAPAIAAADKGPSAEKAAAPQLKPASQPEAAAKPDGKAEVPEPAMPEAQWVTLGSADPKDPYRMLVTLTNRGAAVTRVELNSSNYTDQDDRSGYLGHLFAETSHGSGGARVDVVGQGTPAALGGMQPKDVITKIDGQKVRSGEDLDEALSKRKPGQSVALTVVRDGKELALGPIVLRRRPMEVIGPENNDPQLRQPGEGFRHESDDPLSLLTTLDQFDDQKLKGEGTFADNGLELPGVKMRTGTWSLVEADRQKAAFRIELPGYGLEVTKTYRLEKVPATALADANFKAYHLVLDVSVRNVDQHGKAHKVAYRLDGPTGLPTEGYWYATSKVERGWGSGLRDVVVSFNGQTPSMISSSTIAEDKINYWRDEALSYIGVDAQFFSAVLIPQSADPKEVLFSQSQPLRVGAVDKQWSRLTDTSVRLISVERELKPKESLDNRFVVFIGPKKPAIIDQYGLGALVYYGWFEIFAVPLVTVLHLFYAIFHNYGIAIILLTVLVRGCMFPLSRRQAMGAQKMAELQPEIKRIQEKHKGNVEARTKAQQELFRKHEYNPLAGCLPVFIQLPIFVALYRSLMVDVELRGAPLITHSFRWCSNLAAPDMLFNWESFMPDFVTHGPGMLGLGPYFNILPLVTIVLFLWQQQKMMPPPADEQAAMQQKIMKYMMIFMGVMFFKVASGLCLYFIASSTWGIVERKFLPKTAKPQSGPPAEPKPGLLARLTNGNGEKESRRDKNRRRSRGR